MEKQQEKLCMEQFNDLHQHASEAQLVSAWNGRAGFDFREAWGRCLTANRPAPAEISKPHTWDEDGEHCLKCGASDWMMGGCS